MDIDYYCAAKIKDRLNFMKIKPREKISIADNSFDMILVLQTLHHVVDLDLKLKEIYRILKPGGLLLLREHDCRNVYIAQLIDIEHMLYSIVYEKLTYENAKKEYIGTIYRSKEAWRKILTENYNLKFIREIEPKMRFNPTMYYNAIYMK